MRWVGPALVAALAGCASLAGGSLSIETDWDPEAHFDALSSWDWLPGPADSGDFAAPQPSPSDERVRAAVAAELEARGYPRTSGAPSFWVHPMARIEDVVAAEAQAVYAEVPPWMRDALRDTHVIVGQRGLLVVDVIDPTTRRPLWRGAVGGGVDSAASPAARARRLREAVRRLLERFPPG
jgi:hypothetical protein